MENIIEPDSNFLFEEITLGFPSSISNGSFFTKIFWKTKPLFIQTPKSLTKNGFIKNNNKKIYCDLLFDANDYIFITWMEQLENKIIDLLYEKCDDWFENKMEKTDIENFFTSPLKIYKSGKYYLLKTIVKQNIHIYNENNDIVLLENINNEVNLISILEIKGIKFTNKSFMFDFEMKQSMLVSPDPFLEVCYIKKPSFHIKSNDNLNTTSNTNNTVNMNINNNKTNDNVNNNIDINNNIIEINENISYGSGSGSLERITHIKPNEEENNINSLEETDNIIDFNDDEKVNKIEKLIDIIKKSEYDDKNNSNNNNNKYLEENITIKNDNNLSLNLDYEDNEENENIGNNSKSLKIKFSDDTIVDDDENESNGLLTIYDNDVNNGTLKTIEFEEIFDDKDNNSVNNINLQEIDIEQSLSLTNNTETIKLRKPNEVYYNLYKDAVKKAKELKNKSLYAYMEAENIKKTYMLENVDNEDSSDEE